MAPMAASARRTVRCDLVARMYLKRRGYGESTTPSAVLRRLSLWRLSLGEGFAYFVAATSALAFRRPLRVKRAASRNEAAWPAEERRPGESADWRITVEEWERLEGGPLPNGERRQESRIVYADHLPL